MNNNYIWDNLVEIIADKLGVELSEVSYNASFVNDLGADSLDTVELVMEAEKRFNVTVPESVAENITTVGDVYEFLLKKLEENHVQSENVVNDRESIYRQASDSIDAKNFDSAKSLLMSLLDNVEDAWGMFASFDLLSNAEDFGLSDQEKFNISKEAASLRDYSDEFDESKDFYYCWRSCINYFGLNCIGVDNPKAYHLFVKAAELGFPVSYYNIAWCYQNGVGVDLNKRKALEYYRQSKDRGYQSEDIDGLISDLQTEINNSIDVSEAVSSVVKSKDNAIINTDSDNLHSNKLANSYEEFDVAKLSDNDQEYLSKYKSLLSIGFSPKAKMMLSLTQKKLSISDERAAKLRNLIK